MAVAGVAEFVVPSPTDFEDFVRERATTLLRMAVVLTVLTGMSHTAMILGLSWLGVGLAYGAMLAKRRRVSLEL